MFQSFLFLQAKPAAEEVVKQTESIFAMLMKGSVIGPVIIILLIILMFVALAIFIERYLTIKRASEIDDSFMNNIRMHVQTSNLQAARTLCQNTDSPVARMVEKGLMRIGKPLDDIEHAIENVGKLEVYKMEKNINILSIIAGVAPMFGFLGTIAGMIQTFQSLSTATKLDIAHISGGIYVKMFTSGFGLICGIMAFVFYNLLNNMIDRVVHKMENSTVAFVDFLQEPSN